MGNSPREILMTFAQAVLQGKKATLATVVRSPGQPPVGTRMMVTDEEVLGSLGNASLEEAVKRDCLEAMVEGSHREVSYGTGEKATESVVLFLEVASLRPSLLIAGAGHIGQALANLAKLVGLRVAVLDDRPDFASQERFPEADEVLAGDFVTTLASYPITEATYIVLVTRGHRHDEACLRQVLLSPAAYIGMIGSRRRVTTVLRHLAEEGLPVDRLQRVYSPIGLDIGAEAPEEIALSILAEIIMVRRGGTGRPLALWSR